MKLYFFSTVCLIKVAQTNTNNILNMVDPGWNNVCSRFEENLQNTRFYNFTSSPRNYISREAPVCGVIKF